MKTFSKISILILIAGSSILFMGCPASTKFPLGPGNEQKVDKNLLGTWIANSSDAEGQMFTVEKLDDYTYDVLIDSTGKYFGASTTRFKGWTTKVDGLNFFILQSVVDGEPIEEYFQYQFELRNDVLTTQNITFPDGGGNTITSTESYRELVSASLHVYGSLKSTLTYHKQ